MSTLMFLLSIFLVINPLLAVEHCICEKVKENDEPEPLPTTKAPTEERKKYKVTAEVGEKVQGKKIIPSFNNVDKADIVQDLKKNLSMFRLPETKRCYLARLDPNLLKTKTLRQELQQVKTDGKYVETKWKIIGEVNDRTTLSDEMALLCAKFPIYRVEPVKSTTSANKVNLRTNRRKPKDIYEINEKAGLDLFEGDIVLDKEMENQIFNRQVEHKKDTITSNQKKWPGGKLYYTLDSSLGFAAKRAVNQAFQYISSRTCIKFVSRTTQSSYVKIYNEKNPNRAGCWSFVGRDPRNREQKLSISSGCETMDTALHELYHALGFFHEQRRLDRDDYVRVDLNNVKPGKKHNFNMYASGTADTLGAPYDYGSAMHYGSKAFSRNNKNTIIPKYGWVGQIGMQQTLSDVDVWQLNKLYSCPGTSRYPPCGKNYPRYIAIPRSSGNKEIASPDYPNNYGDNNNCVWRINDPNRLSQIKLEFNAFDLEQSSSCKYDSVEVRDGWSDSSSSRLIGKFCGSKSPRTVYAFSGEMEVKFTTDRSVTKTGFHANIRTLYLSPYYSNGVVSSNGGVILSPDYPRNYGNNKNSVMVVHASYGLRLKLHFTNFDLESHSSCNYDYLELRDGSTSSSPLLGKYCGSVTPSITYASSGTLRLNFVSDGSMTKKGYRAIFQGVP